MPPFLRPLLVLPTFQRFTKFITKAPVYWGRKQLSASWEVSSVAAEKLLPERFVGTAHALGVQSQQEPLG